MAANIPNSIDYTLAAQDQQDDQFHKLGLSEPQMHRFGDILRTLNLKAIPAFASNIRQLGHHTTEIISKSCCESDLIPCKIVDLPLCGSFHIVFTLEFDDGVKWMLKISANGHRFDSVAAAALISEARTMQLLKRETTIPVPAVYAFDESSSNDLNSPFILMERIDGKPLWQGWFDDEIPKARLEHFRIKALQSLAEAMAQLNKFTLNRGGALEFDSSGKPIGLRGAKVVDAVATYNKGMGLEDVSKSNQNGATDHDHHDGYDASHDDSQDNDNFPDPNSISKTDSKDNKCQDHDDEDDDIICEKGPFECPKSAFLFDVDRSDVNPKDRKLIHGCYKALRIFIDLAFSTFEDPGRRFVLNHPDLDVQNVLVADDGTLRGLIDWDGVASVPREVGCAQYPLWLMRDWVPYYYVYDEQERKTEEDAGYEESSPAELASYRALYAHFIEKEIERQTGGPDRVTTFGTLPKQEAQLTRRSLVMRDLNLAGSSPFLTVNVMCHILNQIEQVTEADWGDMDTDLVGSDFDSACSSEGAVDCDSDTDPNVDSDRDEKHLESDIIKSNGDISSRSAADVERKILESVASRALEQIREGSSVIQKHCHESEVLSKPGSMEAEAPKMIQPSKSNPEAQSSSKFAPLGWGRKILHYGCFTAETALRGLVKMGHILENAVDDVAEVLAEVEGRHKGGIEHYSDGEPGPSIGNPSHIQPSGAEVFNLTGTGETELGQPTQRVVEPGKAQDIQSFQATVKHQLTPSAQDTVESNETAKAPQIIQPILIRDIPARKAELVEAEKARRKAIYRTDKAAIKEELKVWERIAMLVWCRGVSLEQLRTNRLKIARWVVNTLQAEEEQEEDLVEDFPNPSAADSAEQGAVQSKEEPVPFNAISLKPQPDAGLCLARSSRTSKRKCARKGRNKPVASTGPKMLLDMANENFSVPEVSTQVGIPPESTPSPSSQARPIVQDLMQRVVSSDNLKSLYTFGTSCLKKAFSNSNKSEDCKASLKSDSSATASKGGDSDGTGTGKSCKSSVTSLSDEGMDFDKGVNAKEAKEDISEAAATHAAGNNVSKRDRNSNTNVWEELKARKAMEKIDPQELPTCPGAWVTEERAKKLWCPRKFYDPCSGEWVEVKEACEQTKTGLEERIAETKTQGGGEDGLGAESEKHPGDGEDDDNISDSSDHPVNDESDFKTFEDDGDFRSQNVFMLLGMDMLDDIRLLRMQEGFLKLLEQF